MDVEIAQMKKRNVWTLVKTPGKEPIGCRWVYTVKRDEHGNIAKYKARLVAQGFKQIKGETYDETFSPVVNFGIIRFLFSLLVSNQRWCHIQCDVTGAYLYATLKDEIYMLQPPGFEKPTREKLCCRLNKAIYGLHQSGRLWYYEINNVLQNLGFTKLEWCNCTYSFKNDLVLILYVDDMVLFGRNRSIIDNALTLLHSKFDLKILGKTKKLLGVEFEEGTSGVEIHQANYIREVCDRFHSFHYPIKSLPISKGIVYSKTHSPHTKEEELEMKKIPYKSLLGCLSFIANRTRPDLSYAVNIFSQFQANPGKFHWDGLLKLLGYTSNTRNLKLKLTCNHVQIRTYSDADFAANRDDRTSIGGQLVLLDRAPIAWRTFKEKSVSLSTMEAEFVAMTEAAKELLWFDRVCKECYMFKLIPGGKMKSVLYVDNMATIDFVKSPIENYRTKHIDIKLFFVRDLVYKDIFELKFVRSKLNMADVFTKPFTKFELHNFIACLFEINA